MENELKLLSLLILFYFILLLQNYKNEMFLRHFATEHHKMLLLGS